MNTCLDCSNDNPPFAEFCQKCGAKLKRGLSTRPRPRVKSTTDDSTFDQPNRADLELLRQEVSFLSVSLRDHRKGVATVLSVFLPGLGSVYQGRLSGLVLSVGWLASISFFIQWCFATISEASNTLARYGYSYAPASHLESLTFWHWAAGIALIAVWLGNIVYTASSD